MRIELAQRLEQGPGRVTSLSARATPFVWAADVTEGAGAYAVAIRRQRPGVSEALDQKLAALGQTFDSVRFTALSLDDGHFRTLLSWAGGGDQRARLAAFQAGAGAFFTLSADGQLAAAQFFLRDGGVLRQCLRGSDPGFAAYAPDLLLTRWAIGWAGDKGLRDVELSGVSRVLATRHGRRVIEAANAPA